MKCNLLHINFKKCCYMHFTPNRNDIVPNDGTLLLTLNGSVIKRVIETKFLGVIIDDKLKWQSHTSYLNSKLKCEIGKLHRMKSCIPKHLYKDIYHTLFESHLSYGISSWGGISQNKLKPLFITQKKCVRVMFGDNEAYFNKFITCVRTRPRESQKLGKEFYEQEHSKPLFNDNNLLTVYQLYKYHCTLEMFKIVKLRLPISLYSLFNMSNRRENYFITPNPSTSFVYQSALMWNSCYKLSSLYNIEFSTAIVTVKHKLKTVLLNAQKQFDKSIWFPNNHDLSGISF